MKKPSKRTKSNLALVDRTKTYDITEAVDLLKKTANTKFVGSVEVHVNTNIDPKKTDQLIRGSVSLSHGTGKKLRVAAFVPESKEEDAKAAGATIVGGEDLIKKIKETEATDFDVAVADTSLMPKLASIAKVLGTRGLMPNPKTGTVGDNISAMIKEIAGGKINFKNDDTANVHVIIGKTDFDADKIIENFKQFLKALQSAKPTGIKGTFLSTITMNSTMGPGIRVKIQ